MLVTGASGFLGEVVCDQLLERDHEIHALVRRRGSEPSGTLAAAGDLTDAGSLTSAVESAAPECVVHLAAEIDRFSSAAPACRALVRPPDSWLAREISPP